MTSQKESRPKKLDFEQFEAVVTSNPANTVEEFAEKFNVTHRTVLG